MAEFTITIPDDKATAVVDSFCQKFGYTENSPLTRPQFAKQMIRDFVRNTYIEQTKTSFDMRRKELAAEATINMDDVDVS